MKNFAKWLLAPAMAVVFVMVMDALTHHDKEKTFQLVALAGLIGTIRARLDKL